MIQEDKLTLSCELVLGDQNVASLTKRRTKRQFSKMLFLRHVESDTPDHPSPLHVGRNEQLRAGTSSRQRPPIKWCAPTWVIRPISQDLPHH